MNCTNARKLLDVYLDGDLPVAEASALAQHHAACAECRAEFEAARSLREKLRRLSAPVQPLGFEARMMRMAAQANRRTQRWSQFRVATVAIAATLAVAVGLGVLLPKPLSNQAPRSGGVLPATGVVQIPQTVRLVFKAPKALAGAKLRIELPQGVEIAAYPGQRVLEWTTDLSEGANLLELPVIGESREPLIATLVYGRSERRFLATLPSRSGVSKLSPGNAGEDIQHA